MNNSVTLVGHLGKEPISKSFGDTGNKVIKFSVAVKEYSFNLDEEETMWVDVDAWNGLGDRVFQTITKGREVVVNAYSHRKWPPNRIENGRAIAFNLAT